MKIHKKFFLISALLFGLYGFQAVASTKDTIVVWKLVARSAISSDEVESISGYLASQVEQISGRKVISESDVETILETEAKKQSCGADDTLCMAEIGGALGVPEAMSGDIGKVGNTWIINLRRIDVEKVAVIKRLSRHIKGSIDDVIKEIPNMVNEIFILNSSKSKKTSTNLIPTNKIDQKPKTQQLSTANHLDYKLYSYISFAAGLGLLSIGGYGNLQMNKAADDYNQTGELAAKDQHETWNYVSNIGYAGGGSLLVTGIVLWVLNINKDNKINKDKLSSKINYFIQQNNDQFMIKIVGRY